MRSMVEGPPPQTADFVGCPSPTPLRGAVPLPRKRGEDLNQLQR